jgi:hypothetical protein
MDPSLPAFQFLSLPLHPPVTFLLSALLPAPILILPAPLFLLTFLPPSSSCPRSSCPLSSSLSSSLPAPHLLLRECAQFHSRHTANMLCFILRSGPIHTRSSAHSLN